MDNTNNINNINNINYTNNINILSNRLYNTLKQLINKIIYTNNFNNNNIDHIFLLLFNFLFLFKLLLNFFYNIINNYKDDIKKYNINILCIINDVDNFHYNLIDKYSSLNKIYKNITYQKIIDNYINNTNYVNNKILNHNNIKDNINLELIDINILINFRYEKMDNLDTIVNNKIPYEYVNIGFNNIYKLHIYNNLNEDIPFNELVYVKNIDQVVIKVGNENKYKYINSKLYRTYDIKNKNNNDRSILCNNNIKLLNKKCQNGKDCRYYHDVIIGYEDNAHTNRQFSYNPIIYNCMTFKDGFYVQENTKKIKWEDAINLYQSNLSCILIGCMHSIH